MNDEGICLAFYLGCVKNFKYGRLLCRWASAAGEKLCKYVKCKVKYRTEDA